MKKRICPATFVLLVSPAAFGQVSSEGFETSNPDGWALWFSVYNTVVPTGGNPGAYLELDNFNQGTANCQFVEMFPDGNPGSASYAHSGNWRASGVTDVTIDLNIEQGVFQGDLRIELISDPGTPGDTSDDCIAFLNLPGVGAGTPGWMTYSFPVPSAEMTLPMAWEVDPISPCSIGSLDAAWNTVIEDVDQIRFVYDGDPLAFCTFTNWLLGVDNIEVNGTGAPPVGTNYCTAVANSTGSAAEMSAVGSSTVADSDVVLTSAAMPNGSFGYFLTSMTQDLVPNPNMSSGNLCLGGAIGRFVGPGQIQNSGTSGQISLTLDLTLHPTPTGFVQVMVGDTWNFTCWFRDTDASGALTSNFADGYSVQFL